MQAPEVWLIKIILQGAALIAVFIKLHVTYITHIHVDAVDWVGGA